MNTKTPRAYSYIRFSTPEQMAGDSLRRQTAAAAKWAKERQIELDNSSFQDLGVSAYQGDNADVGMLGEFQAAVHAGIIARGSYLLIENLDRLSRDKPRRAVRLLENICEAGITVVTLSDNKEYSLEIIDGDPMAMMWAFMTAVRANEESAMKSRRVREAWGRKKDLAESELRPLTARLPAWLRLSADRNAVEVVEERAEIIRTIFQRTLAGSGQHKIATELTRDGVETFGDGRRKALIWHRSYIKKILENTAVIGTFTPHDTRKVRGRRVRDPRTPIPGFFPAIVDLEIFERVASMRTGITAPKTRAGREVSNVLAGLAKCPKCGATMTRINKGRKGGTPYLVCTTAKGGGGCQYKQVRLEGIEVMLREKVGEFVRDCPSRDPILDEQRLKIEGQLAGLDSSMDYLIVEIETTGGNPRIRSRMSELEALRSKWELDLQQLEDQIDKSGGHAVDLRLGRLVDVLKEDKSTPTEINAALREAFTKCTVDYETGQLKWYWKHNEAPTEMLYAWVNHSST